MFYYIFGDLGPVLEQVEGVTGQDFWGYKKRRVSAPFSFDFDFVLYKDFDFETFEC